MMLRLSFNRSTRPGRKTKKGETTMARPGITREQVFSACDELTARDETPTIDKIRALIGGSPNTVHKYKREWEIENPQKNRNPADEVRRLERVVADLEKDLANAQALAEARQEIVDLLREQLAAAQKP
jgi:DNA-binding transcriptional MocR family regulator